MASDWTKGVTLNINGDNTTLMQALKEPQKETKNLKQQLLDVNKALKLDPGNTDLIEQKQRLLGKAIESNKDKLALLKDAQKQFIESGKDIDSKEYTSLEGYIASVQKTIQNLEQEQRRAGDTLTQALREPQQESQKLKTQLEQVNKALKLDPGNAELITSKEKILAQAIEESKKQLTLLTEEQERFKESGQDITGEEYTRLQEQIANVKNDLQELESQASASRSIANAFSAVGNGLQTTGEAITSAGKALTPVSAAAGAGLGAAFKAYSEIDKMNDAIAKGTGQTGEELKKLQETGKNVFASFPEEAETVGNALADVNTHFGFTDKVLDESVKKFLQFSKVNGVDVSSAIESVQLAMSNANIPAEQLGDVLDQLTYASQNSGVGVDQLANSFAKYGTQMQGLDYTFEDTVSMLANFEKQGVDAQTVMTGMRTAFNTCAKEGMDSAAALQDFFNGVADGSKVEADAVALFGTRAGGAIYELAQQGKLNYEEFKTGVLDANGQLESSYEEMAGPQEEMQVAMNNLQIAGGELGNVLAKQLTPVIQKLSEKIQAFGKWFSSLDENTKKWIVTLGGILAVGAPVLLLVGKLVSTIGMLVSGIGTAIGWISSFTSILGGIGGSISLGPLLAVVGAIAAIGAAVWDLWNNSEEFRSAITETWNKICGVFSGFCDTFMGYWNTLCEVVSGIWNEFVGMFAPVLEAAFSTIGDIIQGALDFISGIFGAFVSLISGDWQGFADGLIQAWTACWDTLIDIISKMLPAIWDFICDIFSKILEWLGGCWDGIVNGAQQAWQKVCNAITGALQSAWNFITDLFGNIGQWFQDRFNDVLGVFNGFIDGVKGIWNTATGWLGFDTKNISLEKQVVWNGKAMDNGVIYDKATIFGMDKLGRLLGAGEAGSETVVGTGSLLSMIGQAVREQMAFNQIQSNNEAIDYAKMGQAFASAITGIQFENTVYLDPRQGAASFAPYMDTELAKRSKRR